MKSKELTSLKEELNAEDRFFYSQKTVSDFFVFAPSEEFKEGYNLLTEFNKKYSEKGFIAEKVKEGYTLESACRALTCSYLLKFMEEEVIESISKTIPDLKIAKEKGIESLLLH